MCTITVSQEGKAFFSLDGQQYRIQVLGMIGNHYGIQFTEEQRQRFSMITGFGMPLEELGTWLNLNPGKRSDFDQPGIPLDSANNELRDWAVFARIVNPQVRLAVKGDRKTPYPVMHDVLDMLVSNNINRFNLITDLEKELILSN